MCLIRQPCGPGRTRSGQRQRCHWQLWFCTFLTRPTCASACHDSPGLSGRNRSAPIVKELSAVDRPVMTAGTIHTPRSYGSSLRYGTPTNRAARPIPARFPFPLNNLAANGYSDPGGTPLSIHGSRVLGRCFCAAFFAAWILLPLVATTQLFHFNTNPQQST